MKRKPAIVIDSREGQADKSADLVRYIKPHMAVTRALLPSCDAMIIGNGEDKDGNWKPMKIGIERKRLNDMMSSMSSGHTAVQMQTAIESGFDVLYLLFEGLFRYTASGQLQTLKRATMSGKSEWTDVTLAGQVFRASQLIGFQNTMMMKSGIHVLRSGSTEESAAILMGLARWWIEKDWDEHRSHIPIQFNPTMSRKVTPTRKFFSTIPGVGWTMSARLETAFPSVIALINAQPEAIAEVRGIGRKSAMTIYKSLRGG